MLKPIYNFIMQGTDGKLTVLVGGSLKMGTMISITVNNYLGKQKDPRKYISSDVCLQPNFNFAML